MIGARTEVPRWVVVTALAIGVLAPFVFVTLDAAVAPPDESHGLVSIVYVAAAAAIVLSWLPLGLTLAYVRRRGASSRRAAAWIAGIGLFALAIGATVLIDAATGRLVPIQAGDLAYALAGATAVAAAAVAGAMAVRVWRTRPRTGASPM